MTYFTNRKLADALLPTHGLHSLIERLGFGGGHGDDSCRCEDMEGRLLMSSATEHGADLHIVVPARQVAPALHAAKAKAAAAAPKATAKKTPTKATPKPTKASATTLGSPTGVAVTALTPTSAQVTWTSGDATSAGFIVLRGTDGTHFSQVTKLAGAATGSFNNTGLTSAHTYDYEVEAYLGSTTSAPSTVAAVTLGLIAPVKLTATATSASKVTLTWTINEPAATGYNILRSTDGTNFTQVGTLTSLKAGGTYADTTVASDTAYTYQVQAINASNASALTTSALVTTPVAAPTALAAAFSSAAVNLTWTDNDTTATGYYVLRSGDGKTFTQLANVTDPNAASYVDSTALTGHVYYYKVEAYAGSNLSAPTAAVTTTTPLSAPSGLATNATSPKIVTLTWTDNDANAAGYVILRATGSGKYATLAKATGAALATYTDKTATSGTTYNYEVESYTGTIISAASDPATATTALTAPATITATAPSPTSVKVTWAASDGLATGYNVLRSTDGTNFTQLTTLSGKSATTYTDTTVSSASTYYYEVQATNTSNASATSTSISVTTPLVAPTASAAALSSGAAVLTWTDNDTAAGGYVILRSTDGKSYTQLTKLTDGALASYSDSTVLTGHAYGYEVQAYLGTDTSTISAPSTLSVPLNAPSGVTATASGANTVTLAWTDNDNNAAGYSILRQTGSASYASIGKVTGVAQATYTDKTAVSGTSYNYEVQAYNGTITSPASAPANALTPLTAPATITAVGVTPTSVKITWAASDPLATGYIIQRSTDDTNFTQLQVISGKTTVTYTDATATSATPYYYEVQATNSANASAWSKAATVTTGLAAPSGLTAATDGTSVDLSWTDNEPAAAGYYIYRSVDGKTATQLTKITDGTATSYTDATTTTGNAYSYSVQAYEGTAVSASSAGAIAGIALASPSGLTATATSATTATLTWTDNDTNAAGYVILRTTDGINFSIDAKIAGPTLTTYTDTATAGSTVTYAVAGYTSAVGSPPSSTAVVTFPLLTPTGVTATVLGPTSVKIAWTNKATTATGYSVLRSSDGGASFAPLTTISSVATVTYTDTTASSGTIYMYEVEATNATNESLAAKSAAVATPLISPTGLTATAQTSGGVSLSWTDNDTGATAYNILRSTDGKTFAAVTAAAVSDGTATAATDSTALSGHTYWYAVQAAAGSLVSVPSTPVSVSTALAAPSGLTVASRTSAGVVLTWTDNDANATGYYVLRSSDGGTTFTTLATVTGATTATYTDIKLTTGASYAYEVQAYAGTIKSAASGTATTTVPLATPGSFTATLTGAYVSLSWVDKDASAIGYVILRSTDNTNFTTLTTLSSATASSYIDMSVSAGQVYYYEVQATGTTVNSSASAAVTVTTPSGNVSTGVSVVTRYGDELVITAAGTSDSISITQSGSTLTIVGDGNTFTDAVPAGGVFVYTRGGSDSINIDSSVTAQTTIAAIDGATTAINTTGTNVIAWIDSTDTLVGTTLTTNRVASYAGSVAKTLGASLANPKDAGTTAKDALSLFGTGPVAADINQGEVGDCYFLSSLGAFANQDPQVLVNSAVDLGDGTYAVRFYSSGKPVYVRVNNSFTTGGFGGYLYAHPGANNTLWGAVFEKAFCYFRTGANTYASISSGWMDEVYSDLGVGTTDITPSALSQTALYTTLSNDLANGLAVTMGTQSAPNLVSDHAYALLSVSMGSNGAPQFVVRNPWGSSGDSLENSQGIATLTYAQFIANFVGLTAAAA